MEKDLEPESYSKRKCYGNPEVPTICSLQQLLDRLQRDHREDVYLYTSGHLNSNKLYKPPVIIPHYWKNAYRSMQDIISSSPEFRARRMLHSQTAKMKDAWVHFTLNTALTPNDEDENSKLFRYLNPKMIVPRIDKESAIKTVLLDDEEEEEEERLKHVGALERPRKVELSLPDVKVLRYPRVTSSRQCARLPPGKDVYRYISSYLAGITKVDSYKKFMSFQNEVLEKRDLHMQDFTGSKVAVSHEKKLRQELQKTCTCTPQHFNNLPIFENIFEDICNSSLIFGDLLKEIKEHYECYMTHLLDTQPHAQYETLLSEVKGMAKSPVRIGTAAQAREELRRAEQAIKKALEHNDRLRSELEKERELLESAKEQSESSKRDLSDEERLTLTEKVEKKRCEILGKLDELQALQKYIKTSLVHSKASEIMESGIKSVENEAVKLETANRILVKKIKAAENNVREIIVKSKFSKEEKGDFLEYIKKYTDIEDIEEDIK